MAMDSFFKNAMKGVELIRRTTYSELRCRGYVLVVSNTEFFRKQQWAAARQSSGNPVGDRTRLFAAFETVIAQSGSGVNTRGNDKTLMDLAMAMKTAGMPMEQWGLPPPIMDKLYPPQMK